VGISWHRRTPDKFCSEGIQKKFGGNWFLNSCLYGIVDEWTPPPKNVEQNILGYVDCLKSCSLFLLIAQFNNNKRPPHNTSTTHNNNQNEPPLPYPWRLCPLIPWACQQRPQRMALRLPMAPRKAPVIGFGRAMVGFLFGGAK
jgi:hypothetical protein